LLQWLANLAVRKDPLPIYSDSTARLKFWLRIALCLKIIAMDQASLHENSQQKPADSLRVDFSSQSFNMV